MEKIKRIVLAVLLAVVFCSCDKKAEEPFDWSRMGSVYIGYKNLPVPFGVRLPHNSYKQIFKELKDPQTMQLIAASAGCSKEDLKNIRLTFSDKELISIHIYLTGNDERIFDAMHDKIKYYVDNRNSGHTKEFLIASLDSHKNENITDVDIRNFIDLYPDIPSTWLKKVDEQKENINYEDVRVVNYVLIDGPIAWKYSLYYRPDGTFEKGWDNHKCDAKEYDPKYKTIMDEVNKQVNEKMERENIVGLGSCHAFWAYKKEFLKQKGIDWKSPSELNPNISFD